MESLIEKILNHPYNRVPLLVSNDSSKTSEKDNIKSFVEILVALSLLSEETIKRLDDAHLEALDNSFENITEQIAVDIRSVMSLVESKKNFAFAEKRVELINSIVKIKNEQAIILANEIRDRNLLKHSINEECAICLGDIKSASQFSLLCSCRHAFCSICILTWLERKNSCPMCRAEVMCLHENSSSEQLDDEV